MPDPRYVSEETFIDELGLEVEHCSSCHSDMAYADESGLNWAGVLVTHAGMEVEEACCSVPTALERTLTDGEAP